jgi:hypothetical protein
MLVLVADSGDANIARIHGAENPDSLTTLGL